VCGRSVKLYDHAEMRTWRHLDSCQFQTHLHARVPRVACPEHGVRNASLPWGERGSRFTMLMERLIIDVLQQCQTIVGACRLLGINWDQAMGVMTRAVRRGQARKEQRPLNYIGADEKSLRRGHDYVTIVSDLEQSTVEYVAPGRDTDSLAGFYRQLSAPQRQQIKAVALDMSLPYVRATADCLPGGETKIVFDRFHIMKMVTDALDRVRRSENQQLSRMGDDTLNRTRHLWLWSWQNLPEKHHDRLEQLRKRDLKTARAWAMKENLRRLWDQPDGASAKRLFTRWYNWVIRSKLRPMMHVARTLKQKLPNILSYCDHPITTGVCEGLNSKIMTIKRKAAGFQNVANFIQVVLFHCGKLDLYP